jgi:hypothetical protein
MARGRIAVQCVMHGVIGFALTIAIVGAIVHYCVPNPELLPGGRVAMHCAVYISGALGALGAGYGRWYRMK